MAMATPSAAETRPLAQQLLRTRGQGIAVFVQERVHSTTVGLDAAAAFVRQLLAELEASVAVLAVDDASALQLTDEQELELGSLISASSLTIRYVTEREAMTPVLDRFRAAFQTALRFPLWTKPLLGLKMVSLMGVTRLLESFGEHVKAPQVAADLQWLFAQFFQRDGEDTPAFVERVNYLFRPACEQLTVAVQSHPAILQSVYDDLVPMLFRLAPVFDVGVSDGVASELVATVAVIFDLRLSAPTASAFALLPMPAFAREDTSKDDAEEENIHILQRGDDVDGTKAATVVLPAASVVGAFTETLVAWMEIDGRRLSVIANLPHICGAMVAAQVETPRESLCQALVSSLQAQELQEAKQFEIFQALLECIRDLGLRNAVPRGLEQEVYAMLKDVMPRLQVALKSLNVGSEELRTIKATCSKSRDVLVEAFVWWIHYAAQTDVFAAVRDDFLGSVVDKLADPRLQGDLLYVSRRVLDDEQFELAVETATAPLVRAAKQLDRYSKVASTRIIDGIARVAAGAGSSLGRFVDDLAVPLIQPVLEGSRKSRTSRLNAVASLLVSCVPEASFVLDGHAWIQHLIDVLLEASAAHAVHSMVILEQLVRSDAKLRAFVARAAASSQELVAHIVQNSLSSWPIFTEDMDAVLLVLAILSALLEEEELRAKVDVPVLTSTVKKLKANAEADDQSDLADACVDVLKALANA